MCHVYEILNCPDLLIERLKQFPIFATIKLRPIQDTVLERL